MKPLLFLLALGLVGCGDEDTTVVDDKYIVRHYPTRAFIVSDDRICEFRVERVIVRGFLKYDKTYQFDAQFDANDVYPDSLSACRALVARYEKYRQELDEKIKKTECGR